MGRNDKSSDRVAKRQDDNQKLCTLLSTIIGSNPQLRFGQILQAFDFVLTKDLGFNGGDIWENEFYVEPEVILERVQKALKERTK